MKRRGLLLLTGLVMVTAQTWADGFPKGCEPRDYQFSNNNLVLNESGVQRLFVIYNQSTLSVEMQRRQTNDTFMSPSLSVSLAAGSWSAFASDLQNLEFECHVTKDENTQKVNCAQHLSVCEYPRAKFALSNMGNYWVSANKGQRDVINDAAAKGIYLHW
jgi:hypothetical protein